MLASDKKYHECRLCDGPLSYRFDLRVLGAYDVRYFECGNCGSLQTEFPFWMEEAYENRNLSIMDTGAAQRNIHNMAACFALSKLFNLRNAIDIGGGDGLLCRMLRDHEINCFVKDKYAVPTYAQGFTEPDFDKPDLLICFELIEHLVNPRDDMEDLFRYDPNALLFSTEIYSQQDENWWYLAPQSGQHVFFYSGEALRQIAEKHGYSAIFSGGFILFLRQSSALKRLVARFVLSRIVCRLVRGIIVMLPARGVWKDHVRQIEKSKSI